ncbi:MAG: hypothetical protein LBM60_01755 [Clostridium sp.]|nr:hypothetical protein [Clostridium sp.]
MIEAVLAKSDLSEPTRIQIQVDIDRKHFVSTRLRSDDDQPAVSDDQPAVSDDQPAEYDDQPAEYDGQLAVSDDQLAVSDDQLAVNDNQLAIDDDPAPPRAPGMKYRHYAPRGELTIVSGLSDQVIAYINHRVGECRAQGHKTGVLASNESRGRYLADLVLYAGDSTDGAQIAANLYRILRAFDENDITVIYTEAFENQELSEAIMNRLSKAAKGRRIHLPAPTQTEEETK